MNTYATPAAVTAAIALPAGTVRLVASDRTDTTVEIAPADASKSRDVKAAEQTAVEYADGVLRIRGQEKNQYFGPTGAIRAVVHLPTASAVEVKAASVEFHAQGAYAAVTVDSEHGSITVDEAAEAHLATVAGDIAVGRLSGSAELSTSKGDITVAEAVRGTVTARTDAGNITVGTAAATAASLDAGTPHGRIRNGVNPTATVTDRLAIHATTSSGDITAATV